MLKTKTIYPYIYWDESDFHKHPDFEYVYRILATKYEGFLEEMNALKEKKQSWVLVSKERAKFIRENFSTKNPESQRYKSFVSKKYIKNQN